MSLHRPKTISSLWLDLRPLKMSRDDIWRESIEIDQRLGREDQQISRSADHQIAESVSYSDIFLNYNITMSKTW
jgi:hypothetical protein